MATLMFPADKVRVLIEHALASKQHRPSYEQAYAELGNAWFEGKVKSEVLYDKIKPALHLVKDDGIYLMSNGVPELMGDVFGQDSGACVYAVGYEPLKAGDPGWDERYEKIRAAVGGDDFVEAVTIDDHLRDIPAGAAFLEIVVSPEQLEFRWMAAAGKKSRT
jgi:Protein of unknown function (DUF3085)